MSIATVTTRGYGTFSDITELPTRGYSQGGEISEPPAPEVETTFPTDRAGGGKAGWNQRKREKQRRDEEEFLEIIKIAMPEIMKYLK